MTDVVVCLLELTLTASLAVVFVALLRTPVRWIAGARAAYGLWLTVPASALTVSLPTLPHPIINTVATNAAITFPDASGSSPNGAAVALVVARGRRVARGGVRALSAALCAR